MSARYLTLRAGSSTTSSPARYVTLGRNAASVAPRSTALSTPSAASASSSSASFAALRHSSKLFALASPSSSTSGLSHLRCYTTAASAAKSKSTEGSASKSSSSSSITFPPLDTFVRRHIGPSDKDVEEMLKTLELPSLDALVAKVVPSNILRPHPLKLEQERPYPRGEKELLEELKQRLNQRQSGSKKNLPLKYYVGQGYYGTITPPVIQRNMLENPGWYTPYTPYQAEIAQGRLESLLNFQTMVADLTGLPVANASLLDEATAAAEAMAMCVGSSGGGSTVSRSGAADKEKEKTFFISKDCHPQTIAVVKTRAEAIGVKVVVGDHRTLDFDQTPLYGCIVQYPTTDGRIEDYDDFVRRAHDKDALVCCATDLLALTMMRPPGEFGADIAFGSAQRFGVPMGFGGPHAAFLSCHDRHKRLLPGRIMGVSKDRTGKPAIRMALQTREQHIRREKATSNICTAQALLANMAAMYAVYHGPDGLTAIARRVHDMATTVASALSSFGYNVGQEPFFDTIRINGVDAEKLYSAFLEEGLNLRKLDSSTVTLSFDETVTEEDVRKLLQVLAKAKGQTTTDFSNLSTFLQRGKGTGNFEGSKHARTSKFLQHPIFNSYHTEHELLRYLHRLEWKDLGLNTSMIPLGSCTMKLNATSEMLPVTWPEINNLHPYGSLAAAEGMIEMQKELERHLCNITGFHAASLQPNAGSQGEYAGLLCIKKYHQRKGQSHRNVCLIPVSAHGTNPATAVMAGLKVVIVACDKDGNIDLNDLRTKAEQHKEKLCALMVTYPSTHGVFEESITDICKVVHENGGLVYMDGANMNAQVGLTSPGHIGADVCHLNLHKTFCIPHGGGGPGVGAIAVAKHLAPHLPGNPLVPECGGEDSIGAISAAPWGSSNISPISYIYIKLMQGEGLTKATQVAILNANYMAKRLQAHYPVLYKGKQGMVGHEFILDMRPFKQTAGVEAEDIAKRLMDYGFHAPTLSFPIPNTLMIEPTESESKAELDRFCDAMISIRKEIAEVEQGKMDPKDNPLKNAPHTQDMVIADEWTHPYSRQRAAFPAPWLHAHKHWPTVARIEGAFGDRNLVCTCPPIESYSTPQQ
ncbi:Glycine dehydrogenase (decarboxylating) [Balamuthia mandrillaris]